MQHSEPTLFDLSRKINKSVLIKIIVIACLIPLNILLSQILILAFVLLVINAISLTLFAPGLITSGTSFAIKSRIPMFVMGLVIFPLLSSLHEVLISAISNITQPQLSEIALATQMSNKLFEMTVSFGMIGYIACKINDRCLSIKGHSDRLVVIRNGVFMILSLGVLAILLLIDRSFSPSDGIILVMIYLLFLAFAFIFSRKGLEKFDETLTTYEDDKKPRLIDLALLMINILVVSYLASNISRYCAILVDTIPYFESYAFLIIGMAIAIPNFIISLTAVRRGEITLSIGYAIGSVVWEMTISVSVIAFTGGITLLSDATVGIISISLLAMAIFSMIYIRTHWMLRTWEAIFIVTTYITSIVLIIIF